LDACHGSKRGRSLSLSLSRFFCKEIISGEGRMDRGKKGINEGRKGAD